MEATTLIDFPRLREVLEDFAKDIRSAYIDHLELHDRIASGDLINSIRTNVIAGDREWEVTMTLADYWKYVEDDTRPHWPPVGAILKWVEIKPVIPRPDTNGRIPKPKQLAFLIARKISQVGTKGSHDLKITKENIIPWYRERLSKALGHDMTLYIRKILVEK